MTLPLCGNVAIWEATDISAAKIARARKIPHSDRLRFSAMDAESLSYEHSTFDAVVAANALTVVQKPDAVLREIRRVLRPGGILFAPTYVFGGRKTSLRMRVMSIGRRQKYRDWTAAEFIDLIRRYGFEVEKAVLVPNGIAPLCYLEARSEK